MKKASYLRKTKIVCTIGPASSSPEKISQLIQAGMDVARLNFSYGNHDTHRRTIRTVRTLSRELGKEIAILQDLGGPKIRIGMLPTQERILGAGEIVILTPNEFSDPGAIPVNYPYIVDDVEIGNRILLVDGLVELIVEEKEADKVICQVLVGGTVQSHKGVNLPSSTLRVPAFTEKDRSDLELGLKENVDLVALSFVRHEKDMEPVRKILKKRGLRPLLMAKIEKPQAIERFDRILDAVDGVMVARGDLGVEMPLTEIPMIQKRIIRQARQSAKPVITATQMLRSMVSSPRPTRAEATDVANAILDGTDALMLSEETAMGSYPVESVQVLDGIARATEPYLQNYDFLNEPMGDLLAPTEAAISRAACRIAHEIGAAAIVAATFSGSTARLVARYRPASPVMALTPHRHIQRRLALSWGVIPVLVKLFSDTDQIFQLARSCVKKKGIGKKGESFIVTAGIPVNISGTTNLLKVIEIES